MDMSPYTQSRAAAEELSFEYYENEVPAFVEAELERLYGNIFSSLTHFRVYGDAENAHTYVAREGGEMVAVFLFRRKNARVQVINEGMRIDESAGILFADYIFSRFRSVNSISFHAVETTIARLPFPCHRFNILEDIVLSMPDTIDKYQARLGKATQRYINRYLNKLKREFPSFCYEVYSGQEVQEQVVRDIVRFNRSRMADKNKISDQSEEETQRLFQLIQRCGFIGLIRLDGVVRAGTINFTSGKNYFLAMIAHDPAFNEYRLGTLCCYLTICECIARGGNEYHFLWGQYDYKYRLQGVQRNLDHLVVYRSPACVLFDGQLILKNAYLDYARRVRVWLHDIKRQDSVGSRLLGQVHKFVRGMKGHFHD